MLIIFHSIYFHSNEPVFASLSALIYQHTLTPLALPIRLVLPQVGILMMMMTMMMMIRLVLPQVGILGWC